MILKYGCRQHRSASPTSDSSGGGSHCSWILVPMQDVALIGKEFDPALGVCNHCCRPWTSTGSTLNLFDIPILYMDIPSLSPGFASGFPLTGIPSPLCSVNLHPAASITFRVMIPTVAEVD